MFIAVLAFFFVTKNPLDIRTHCPPIVVGTMLLESSVHADPEAQRKIDYEAERKSRRRIASVLFLWPLHLDACIVEK